MNKWSQALRVDPLPRLLCSHIEALTYFARRDLLNEIVGLIDDLWELPEALKIVKRQRENGAWRYSGKGRDTYPYNNYDLLETFRNLGLLVEKYGFDREHPAIEKGAKQDTRRMRALRRGLIGCYL
jgi:hypothetical protein